MQTSVQAQRRSAEAMWSRARRKPPIETKQDRRIQPNWAPIQTQAKPARRTSGLGVWPPPQGRRRWPATVEGGPRRRGGQALRSGQHAPSKTSGRQSATGTAAASAAQCRRLQSTSTRPRSRFPRNSSALLLSGGSDQPFQLVDFFLAEFVRQPEERGRRACMRAFEEGLDDLSQRGTLGGGFRHGGRVDIAAVRLVAGDKSFAG